MGLSQWLHCPPKWCHHRAHSSLLLGQARPRYTCPPVSRVLQVEEWGPFDLVYGCTPPLGQACDRPPGKGAPSALIPGQSRPPPPAAHPPSSGTAELADGLRFVKTASLRNQTPIKCPCSASSMWCVLTYVPCEAIAMSPTVTLPITQGPAPSNPVLPPSSRKPASF